MHVSGVIHNEGDVQSASGTFATLSPQEYTDKGRERKKGRVPLKMRVTSITKKVADIAG
jgi:hypothetical protein